MRLAQLVQGRDLLEESLLRALVIAATSPSISGLPEIRTKLKQQV